MDTIITNAYIKGASDLLEGKIPSMPEVVPVIHAKWIYEKITVLVDETDNGAVYDTKYNCKCGNCLRSHGHFYTEIHPSDMYCKYCGAKMNEE